VVISASASAHLLWELGALSSSTVNQSINQSTTTLYTVRVQKKNIHFCFLA